MLCKLFKAIISLRRSEKFPSLFRTGTVEHPILFYAFVQTCIVTHFFPFWSYKYSKQSTSATFTRGLSYSKIRSHREAPASIIVQIPPSTSFSVPSRTALLIIIFKTDALYRANRASKITAHRQYKKHYPLSFCLLFLPFLLFFWLTNEQATHCTRLRQIRTPPPIAFPSWPSFSQHSPRDPLGVYMEEYSSVQFSSVLANRLSPAFVAWHVRRRLLGLSIYRWETKKKFGWRLAPGASLSRFMLCLAAARFQKRT